MKKTTGTKPANYNSDKDTLLCTKRGCKEKQAEGGEFCQAHLEERVEAYYDEKEFQREQWGKETEELKQYHAKYHKGKFEDCKNCPLLRQ